MGFGIGTATGLASGLRSAYKAGENPWTEKLNIEVTAEDLGISTTMDRIQANESYPHRNDNTIFENRIPKGAASPLLPEKPMGYYREYVHPTPGVVGAGVQRIVTGAGGEYYYTPDHYKTFIRFRY
jgi:guanyl-specific ribonuclease Sa